MWTALCVWIVLIVGGTRPLSGQTQAPPNENWTPLKSWLGSWEGTSKGQPGNGTVKREYRFILRDHFIEVRNVSTYAPQPQNPKGEVHEDVGYISYDRGRNTYVFRQFHVEGFVNTYVGVPTANGDVVFTTESIENIPPGWRARETYRRVNDDERIELFELAEPGKEFTTYSETRLKRTR
jgi:nitrobindin-like protein